MRAVECGPSRGVTGSCCVRDSIHLGVNDALVLIRSLPSRRGLFDSWRKAIVPGCDDVIVRIHKHCADLGAWVLGSRRHKSEEHTSELQSLMRISYADFCLKK